MTKYIKPNKSNWKKVSIDKEAILSEISTTFNEWKDYTQDNKFMTFLSDSFVITINERSISFVFVEWYLGGEYALHYECCSVKNNVTSKWFLKKGDDTLDVTTDIITF